MREKQPPQPDQPFPTELRGIDRDHRVPPDHQARLMIAALEKAGRKPESLLLSGVAPNFGREKSRIEIFKTLVAFLEKNLGPGVE